MSRVDADGTTRHSVLRDTSAIPKDALRAKVTKGEAASAALDAKRLADAAPAKLAAPLEPLTAAQLRTRKLRDARAAHLTSEAVVQQHALAAVVNEAASSATQPAVTAAQRLSLLRARRGLPDAT